jgi:hypothetical protein
MELDRQSIMDTETARTLDDDVMYGAKYAADPGMTIPYSWSLRRRTT